MAYGGVSFADAPSGTTGQPSEQIANTKHTHRKQTDENEENNGPTPPDLGRGFRTLTHGTLPHWCAVEKYKELSSSSGRKFWAKNLCASISSISRSIFFDYKCTVKEHPATSRKNCASHLRLASNHAQVCVSLSGGIRQSSCTKTSVASVIHQR